MQARVDWVLIIFGTQVIKKKRPVRPVFPGYLCVSYDYGNVNSRHFSHVTKSCIFKNLNFRKKVDRNFPGNFLKNHFRDLKLYSNPPSWLARSRCHMGTFWRQKIEVHIFERASLSGFGTWKFTDKEDLKLKPKIWSFFYGKTSIWENSVVWKLQAFGLKISTTSSACCSHPCCIPCRIYYYGLVVGMWQLKRSSISSLNSIIHQPKKLAWV